MQYFESLLAFHNIKLFHLSSSRARPSIHDDDLARLSLAKRGRGSPPAASRSTPQAPSSHRIPRCDPHSLDSSTSRGVRTAVLPLGHGLRSLLLNNIALLATGSPPYTEAATIIDSVFPSIDPEEAQKMAWAKGRKELLGVLADMRLGHAEGGGPWPLHATDLGGPGQ
ncbi:hypothetical protein V8D89_002972 [Ganoderma adspersum]